MRQVITENVQLMDKTYFKGKESDKSLLRHRENILEITGGDAYTKIIADIYFYLLGDSNIMKTEKFDEIEYYYNIIKLYDKNVFPVRGYNINKTGNIYDLMRT